MTTSRLRFVFASTWLLPLAATWQQPASAQPVGEDFQVNTDTTGDQLSPSAAADGSGNFVIVWESDPDASYPDVFGQRFDAAGNPVGDEFQVNTYTPYGQDDPSVAMDAAGKFVVAWAGVGDEGSTGIFARRYDADGSPAGSNFQVDTSILFGSEYDPAIAMDTSGFVVVWTGSDGAQTGVFGRRYDSAGDAVSGVIPINSYTANYQRSPDVAMLTSGSFVVGWQSDGQDGSGSGAFGRRFDATGAPLSSEFPINSHTTGSQFSPRLAPAASGDFVAVWSDYAQPGDVVGQRFSSSGGPLGDPFEVNNGTSSASLPVVASDAAGNFVVVWANTFQVGVVARPFDPAGQPVGDAFQVNTYTTTGPGYFYRVPTIASGGSGNFVVAWQTFGQDGDAHGVAGRRVANTVFGGDAAGFEDGTVCGWDAAVGSSDVCPQPRAGSSLRGFPRWCPTESGGVDGPRGRRQVGEGSLLSSVRCEAARRDGEGR